MTVLITFMDGTEQTTSLPPSTTLLSVEDWVKQGTFGVVSVEIVSFKPE